MRQMCLVFYVWFSLMVGALKGFADESLTSTTTMTQTLKTGWNLVSVPLASTDLFHLQPLLNGKATIAYKFVVGGDGTYRWEKWVNGDNEKTIKSGEGLFVGVPESMNGARLEFSGVASKDFALFQTDEFLVGKWYLLGYSYPMSVDMIQSYYPNSVVWIMKDSKYQKLTNGDIIQAGQGFWFKTKDEKIKAYTSSSASISSSSSSEITVSSSSSSSLSSSSVSSSSSSSLAAEVIETVLPALSEEILLNPGKGWIVYGKSLTDFQTKNPAVWPYATTCYSRFNWSAIQPQKDQFNWNVIDERIAYCQSLGKKFAFGIMPANAQQAALPQWVYDSGVGYYLADNGSKYPQWNDEKFIQLSDALVKALAQRYDGDERIAFIDARSYGNFGEWHLVNIKKTGDTTIEATTQTQNRLVDSWKVFTKTTITLCNGDWTTRPHVIYGKNNYGIAVRSDSSEIYKNGGAYDANGSFPVPSISEWSSTYTSLKSVPNWMHEYWTISGHDAYMKNSRYSYDNLGQWDNDTYTFMNEQLDLVKMWANKMGYWFRIVEASYPSHLGKNRYATLNLKIRNDGASRMLIRKVSHVVEGEPLYVYSKSAVVKIVLLDAQNTPVVTPQILEGIDPFEWKPAENFPQKGEIHQNSAPFIFNNPPSSGVKLAIGLFSNPAFLDPDVRFGSVGHAPNGWFVLNQNEAH